METIILKGISKKGKQRVKQLGARWSILTRQDSVLFNDRVGKYVWLLVCPTGNPDSSRWIHRDSDMDFKIVVE